MTQRTYIPSIVDETTKVCNLLNRARPVLLALFPGNIALLAAVEAARAACQTLRDEAIQEREFGD